MIKLKLFLILIAIIWGGQVSGFAQDKLISVASKSQARFYRGKHLCLPLNLNEKRIFNAVKVNSPVLLEKFLKNGGNPNAVDDCGIAVIFYAVRLARFDLLKILIKAGADLNILDTFYQKPPLFWLIDSYDWLLDDYVENTANDEIYDSIKILIENGANVNPKINSSESLLIQAVIKRKLRLVELLIALGAKINYRDSAEMTAYSYAAQLGDKELRKILIKAGADVRIGVDEYRKQWRENAFFQAAADGRTDVVEAMLASGSDVNSANEAGKMTALMRAQEESTVDSLLAAGANVNLKDSSGHTALMWAVSYRLTGIVKKLIAAGADVSIRNNAGESVFDLISDDKTKAVLQQKRLK